MCWLLLLSVFFFYLFPPHPSTSPFLQHVLANVWKMWAWGQSYLFQPPEIQSGRMFRFGFPKCWLNIIFKPTQTSPPYCFVREQDPGYDLQFSSLWWMVNHVHALTLKNLTNGWWQQSLLCLIDVQSITDGFGKSDTAMLPRHWNITLEK